MAEYGSMKVLFLQPVQTILWSFLVAPKVKRIGVQAVDPK